MKENLYPFFRYEIFTKHHTFLFKILVILVRFESFGFAFAFPRRRRFSIPRRRRLSVLRQAKRVELGYMRSNLLYRTHVPEGSRLHEVCPGLMRTENEKTIPESVFGSGMVFRTVDCCLLRAEKPCRRSMAFSVAVAYRCLRNCLSTSQFDTNVATRPTF